MSTSKRRLKDGTTVYDVREYVENGSLLSDPDTIEASLRSFDFVDPDAAAPHEGAPEG